MLWLFTGIVHLPYPNRFFVSIATCHGTSPALRSFPFTILLPSLEVPVSPHGLHTNVRYIMCSKLWDLEGLYEKFHKLPPGSLAHAEVTDICSTIYG